MLFYIDFDNFTANLLFRMMNFFDLYGLKPGFSIDRLQLKRRYYALSREHHPDFTAGEEALEMSAQVNRGYKILQDEEAILPYILELKGLLAEEEKYSLPPAFLAEVMDINEQLMEIEMDPEPGALDACERETRALLGAETAAVQSIMSGYDHDRVAPAELEALKAYYYKKKYLQRILDKIGALRNIAPPL
jgi:molecular chaperone HscB